MKKKIENVLDDLEESHRAMTPAKLKWDES